MYNLYMLQFVLLRVIIFQIVMSPSLTRSNFHSVMPHTKIQFSKQISSSLPKDTQEFIRQIKQGKNTLHTYQPQHNITLHTVTSNVFFLFLKQQRKSPFTLRGKCKLYLLLKPNSTMNVWPSQWSTGNGEYAGGWKPPHKHFKRKELQEVPRGQSHSFPILAPFRTAHCSPASHCKQHSVWSLESQEAMHVGLNISPPTTLCLSRGTIRPHTISRSLICRESGLKDRKPRAHSFYERLFLQRNVH